MSMGPSSSRLPPGATPARRLLSLFPMAALAVLLAPEGRLRCGVSWIGVVPASGP